MAGSSLYTAAMNDEISEVYNTSEKRKKNGKKKKKKKSINLPEPKGPSLNWFFLDQHSQRSLDNHETVGFQLVK